MTRAEVVIVGAIIGAVGVVSAFSVMTARERVRDIVRFDNVKDLQRGLEYYFNNNGVYPTSLDFIALGETTTACLSEDGFTSPCSASDARALYLEVVPAPPTSGLKGESSCSGEENAYCYASDGANYRIQFELEKPNALLGLVKGANCATETGVVAGACSPFAVSE